MIKTKSTQLTILLLLLTNIINSQVFNDQNYNTELNFISKTPLAETILKVNEIDLNLKKGIPNISIPIYNLEIDNIEKIPIYISYDASGVKVGDISTQVGLKWALISGGGIFRNVYNKSDENGWLTQNWSSINDDFYQQNSLHEKSTQDYIKNPKKGDVYFVEHSPKEYTTIYSTWRVDKVDNQNVYFTYNDTSVTKYTKVFSILSDNRYTTKKGILSRKKIEDLFKKDSIISITRE